MSSRVYESRFHGRISSDSDAATYDLAIAWSAGTHLENRFRGGPYRGIMKATYHVGFGTQLPPGIGHGRFDGTLLVFQANPCVERRQCKLVRKQSIGSALS